MLISDALRAAVPLHAVFVERVAAARPAIVDLIKTATAVGVDVWEVPEGGLDRASDVVSSSGVIAVAARPVTGLPSPVEAGASTLVVVLAGVTDPGNAGTLLRVAEAAGAEAVVFTDGAVDPSNPKCVRASAGSVFRVPVVTEGDGAAVLGELTARHFRRIATVVSGAQAYDAVDLTGPIAIVLGSEAHGLPPTLDEAIDEKVTIPMAGRTESLNVAMAGAVLCFEVLRQRRKNELDGGGGQAAVFENHDR